MCIFYKNLAKNLCILPIDRLLGALRKCTLRR
nr:MAG TPA: hypothetical protein [Caudoviricetes sp.]